MTQSERIVRHLREHGSITSLEALEDYGIMRLASRVADLKKAGVPAEIDIYPGLYHAFDMLTPWRRAGRLAAKRFEKRFLYAQKNFFAENDD